MDVIGASVNPSVAVQNEVLPFRLRMMEVCL